METRGREQHRGRGAVTNPTGRYEATQAVLFDDGWGTIEEERSSPKTVVLPEAVRRIVATNQSPDIPFDKSINPYKGCEHGCVYCYARPTHAWLGLSPGLDFETRIFSKPDAARALRRELKAKSWVPQTLVLGANTDAYQPVEEELGLARQVLEVCRDFGQPVGIITKSARVVRDLDLLVELAERNLVRVMISVTTLDPKLSRVLEPRASSPARRLAAIRRLSKAGVPVGAMMAPIIPALTDAEIEPLVQAVAEAGAQTAGAILLRLPRELKELFEGWLHEHYPDRAGHVLTAIRDTRGGELYQSNFFQRHRGTGAYARMIQRRFEVATRRHGLDRKLAPLATEHFAVPDDGAQLRLFAG
jgi:DNA repair photolyase